MVSTNFRATLKKFFELKRVILASVSS